MVYSETIYELIQTTEFEKWLGKLKDRQVRDIIFARLLRLTRGNFGDVKPVGDRVQECRIHHGAGYRLYFIQQGKQVVVMLAGGNKSSQQRDIKQAKILAEKWK